MSLAFRNFLFSVVVPGSGAVLVPWWDEAWLFLLVALLLYAGAMAVIFHVFVIGYEERTLRRRFGETYTEYVRTVPRWIPRPPRRG